MSKEAQKFGVSMLRALWLDTKNVTGFTIECRVGEFPAVSVTSLVVPDALGECAAQVVRKYRLVLVDEPLDAQPSPDAIAADPVLAAVFGAAASAPAHQCAQQSTLAQPAVGAAPAAPCQATRSGTV